MKKIALIWAFAISALFCESTFAQVSPEQIPFNEQFSFVFNSDVPVKTKITNAKSWIADTFGDYKSVLQFEDVDNNRIIIKGISKLWTKLFLDRGGRDEFTARYTIKFDFKDDRFRIMFDNIKIHKYHQFSRSDKPYESDWSVDFIFRDDYTNDRSLIEWKYQIDSLSNVQGLSNKEMKKVEKERKKLVEKYEERDEELKAKQVDIDAHAADYRRTMSNLVNSAMNAIESNDIFW